MNASFAQRIRTGLVALMVALALALSAVPADAGGPPGGKGGGPPVTPQNITWE